MKKLQKAKIAAMPSFNAQELFTDPHLKERDFIQTTKHCQLGEHLHLGPPWKCSKTRPRIFRPSPLPGEHNMFVLTQYLGFTEEEVRKLELKKIVY